MIVSCLVLFTFVRNYDLAYVGLQIAMARASNCGYRIDMSQKEDRATEDGDQG